jgi:hypothetical protein
MSDEIKVSVRDGEEKNASKILVGKTWREQTFWETKRRWNIKIDLKTYSMWWCGLDSSGSGQVVGSCEQGNESHKSARHFLNSWVTYTSSGGILWEKNKHVIQLTVHSEAAGNEQTFQFLRLSNWRTKQNTERMHDAVTWGCLLTRPRRKGQGRPDPQTKMSKQVAVPEALGHER